MCGGFQYGNTLEGEEGKTAENYPRDMDALEMEMEEREDEIMIREFKERLDFNLRKVSQWLSCAVACLTQQV